MSITDPIELIIPCFLKLSWSTLRTSHIRCSWPNFASLSVRFYVTYWMTRTFGVLTLFWLLAKSSCCSFVVILFNSSLYSSTLIMIVLKLSGEMPITFFSFWRFSSAKTLGCYTKKRSLCLPNFHCPKSKPTPRKYSTIDMKTTSISHWPRNIFFGEVLITWRTEHLTTDLTVHSGEK